MELMDIIKITGTLAGFLFTVLIPTIIVMINRINAVRKANTEAEKQTAINELKAEAQEFIIGAESLYADIDAIVKQQGKSLGAIKKDSVMTKIQDACILKHIEFDKEYWSKVVDDLVTVTRQVNAKV